MYQNKKLVIICNSIPRLRLIDKLNFKDEFNGDVFIVTDDRYSNTYKDIESFIKTEATNINLKKAKITLFIRDMFDYIKGKVNAGKYEDALRNALFTITANAHIYFCRSDKDIAFIVEDDVILFKNPEYLMTGLKACSVRNLPPSPEMSEKLKEFFIMQQPAFKEDVFEKIQMDSTDSNFAVNLDKKFGKLIGQATTIWTYLPDFPEYMRKYLYMPATVKNIIYNRNHGCKLYHRGFTFLLERLIGCFLIAHNASFYTEEELTMQDRTMGIYNAKKIACNEVGAYHYTIIADEYVFKWLPYLLEHGFDKYKEATKGLEETSRDANYQYLDPKLMVGWNARGKLKEKIDANNKKVPFFMRKKLHEQV